MTTTTKTQSEMREERRALIKGLINQRKPTGYIVKVLRQKYGLSRSAAYNNIKNVDTPPKSRTRQTEVKQIKEPTTNQTKLWHFATYRQALPMHG